MYRPSRNRNWILNRSVHPLPSPVHIPPATHRPPLFLLTCAFPRPHPAPPSYDCLYSPQSRLMAHFSPDTEAGRLDHPEWLFRTVVGLMQVWKWGVELGKVWGENIQPP